MQVLLQSRPIAEKLLRYIDSYIHFHHDSGKLYKNLLPCPGVSVIFNFSSMLINGVPAPDVLVIGLHQGLHKIEPAEEKVDTLVLRILPFGCSRFIKKPVSEFTGRVCDGISIFGPSIEQLFNALQSAKDFSRRVMLLDNFFMERLTLPDESDQVILQVAEQLRKEPEPFSFDLLLHPPLSARQLARRFKSVIGVSLQVYIRLCRFEMAKKLFFQEQEHSLTNIGYSSGYYDQSHFSKEFKKLSGLRAKDFMLSRSLQKILHESLAAAPPQMSSSYNF